MRCLTASLAFAAFVGSCLAGDAYNMTVMWKEGTANVYGRVWYGDGKLYVGPTVPASVKTAFNFTVPNNRADFLYVSPVGANASLQDPTFLAVNNAPGAADPVYFAHSATNVTDNDLIYWIRYGNIVFPIFNNGNINAYFFLDSTDTPDTYIVKWNQQGLKPSTSTDGTLAGVGVQLTAINP